MHLDQSGIRVTETSSGHCAGDASENFKEDDTETRPYSANSSTDQHGSCNLHYLTMEHWDLFSPSPQDAQGLLLSTQKVLGGLQCGQEAMGHSISAQAFQRPPTCAERKNRHVSFPRRGSRIPYSDQGVTKHCSSP